MTKKIYYIFTLIGSLLLSSCDSYLDIQPVGQVIPNTLAEYRALFTTAYNTALNDRGICEIRLPVQQPEFLHRKQSWHPGFEIPQPE